MLATSGIAAQSGHSLQLERPDLVINAIQQVLSETGRLYSLLKNSVFLGGAAL